MRRRMKSRKRFSRSASHTRKINVSPKFTRGGIRL